MEKKKIAIVTDRMIVGGVETALIKLLRYFDHDRYQVTLYLNDISGALQSEIDPRVQVRLWCERSPKQVLQQKLRRLDLVGVAKGLYYRAFARKYAHVWDMNSYYSTRCLPKCPEKYDVAIAYNILLPYIIAMTRYCLKANNYILWGHGRNVRTPEYIEFFDKVYDRFDHIIHSSEASRLEFVSLFPISAPKTCVSYNLMDTNDILQRACEQIDLPANRIKLCTVGRLTPVKGQTLIPKIARMLVDQGYDIYWSIVGDGQDLSKLKRSITELGVENHVSLLGTKLNPYPYIKNCDIYVQPSFSEGFCTTTREAKILGRPIVTTDAPGMREQFISGENGLIVDHMTSEALFEGIRYLLDHPEICQKFTESLSKETWDNKGELQKLYDLIEDKK